MKVDPLILKFLLESMNEGVQEMHKLLRAPASIQTLQAMARIAHKLRGEATVVGLANLSQLIISLEDILVRLQDSLEYDKGQWQPITIHLLKIVKVCEHLRKNAAQSRMKNKPRTTKPASSLPLDMGTGLTATLQILAVNVSRSCGKQVMLNLERFDINDVPKIMQAKMQDMIIQLVRNSIAHGIEVPAQREKRGKPMLGTISLITRRTKDELLLAVRDNGCGIDLEEIRRRLVIKLGHSVVAVAKLSKKELLNSLFIPGFSTQEEQSQHAGRGVGLDLVKAHANSLGGGVEVTYKEKEYAQFVVRIPVKEKSNIRRLTPSRAPRAKKAQKFDQIPTLTEVAN